MTLVYWSPRAAGFLRTQTKAECVYPQVPCAQCKSLCLSDATKSRLWVGVKSKQGRRPWKRCSILLLSQNSASRTGILLSGVTICFLKKKKNLLAERQEGKDKVTQSSVCLVATCCWQYYDIWPWIRKKEESQYLQEPLPQLSSVPTILFWTLFQLFM